MKIGFLSSSTLVFRMLMVVLTLGVSVLALDKKSGDTLGSLKLEYDVVRAKLAEPIRGLQAKYDENLQELFERHTQAGELKHVLADKNEIDSYKSGNSVAVDRSKFPELFRIQNIYRAAAAQRQAVYDQKVVPISLEYRTGLLALQKRLTQETDLEGALAVAAVVKQLDATTSGSLVDIKSSNPFSSAKELRLDFSESSWWKQAKLLDEPPMTDVVDKERSASSSIDQKVLKMSMPTGKSETGFAVKLGEVFGRSVNRAQIEFWLRVDGDYSTGGGSGYLPGFFNNRIASGADGINHWSAVFKKSKNSDPESFEGYVFHANMPEGQRYGTKTSFKKRCNLARWNHFEITVENNSITDSDEAPADGRFLVKMNGTEVVDHPKIVFRRTEGLSIETASFLMTAHSSPGTRAESDFDFYLSGVVVRALGE